MKQSRIICPAKKILHTLGQPHVLSIIHALNNEAYGFNSLQEITGVNSRTLTSRLHMLVAEGIVTSTACSNDARCRYYELTAKGKKINKILVKFDSL